MVKAKTSRRRGLAGTGGVSVVAGVVALYFTQTVFAHLVAVAVLFGGLWAVIWGLLIRGSENRNQRVVKVLITTVSALSVSIWFAWWQWPVQGLGELTPDQRARFVEQMKANTARNPVRLMCSPASEIDCIVGAQFVELFVQGGWEVQGRVIHRENPGQPREGVYFVLNGPDADYSVPSQWQKYPAGYLPVVMAFSELVPIAKDPTAGFWLINQLVVGKDFPDGVIGIYFGLGTAEPRK